MSGGCCTARVRPRWHIENSVWLFVLALSELQLGPDLKNDDEESVVQLLDLQLDPTVIPDVNDSDSSSSSFEVQNMNFSVHHFSSSGSDDTTDIISSKLEVTATF